MFEFREPAKGSSDELLYWAVKRSVAHDDSGSTSQAQANMVGISHAANLVDVKAAVLWYEKQQPAPGHAADPKLASEGNELFMNGLPGQHILACKTCHGENADGNAQAPRLAGQNRDYLLSQLARFRKGDRRHAPEMTTEVRDLDPKQARAVVAYLQSR
jgi:cytochrome c553